MINLQEALEHIAQCSDSSALEARYQSILGKK